MRDGKNIKQKNDMKLYSIQTSSGQEVAQARQIYDARKLAQDIANKTNREVSFTSESGKETFKPIGEDGNCNCDACQHGDGH